MLTVYASSRPWPRTLKRCAPDLYIYLGLTRSICLYICLYVCNCVYWCGDVCLGGVLLIILIRAICLFTHICIHTRTGNHRCSIVKCNTCNMPPSR